jgi:hypothetical protein
VDRSLRSALATAECQCGSGLFSYPRVRVKRPPTGSPVAGPQSPAGIPSVGDDDRAGHEARCVGGEEQNDGGDLVDFAHARRWRVVHPSIEHRLRIGGEPGLARQAEEDYSAHPSLRQVQPNRRQVLPRRLCLRRRTRPLHLPGGQRASLILANLRDPQKRRHSRGDTDLSRQQIGLRRSQTQSAVLSECSRPQDPAGSARRCSRRSPCARRNTWRPVAGGRKSRCCSHISSESFASRACA